METGSLIWLLISLSVLLALTGWFALTLFREPAPSPVVMPETVITKVAEKPIVEEPAEDVLWFESEEADTLRKAFLSASSVDAILPLIRNAVRLEPVIRAHYPTDGRIPPEELTGLGTAREIGSGKWKALALPMKTERSGPRLLVICQTPGGLKVDWESWVGYSAMPWAEILKNRPEEPVLVRAWVSPVDYYNMDFSDDRKWRSCRIMSPDGESVLYGYTARKSGEDERMLRVLSGDTGMTPRAALMIRYPEQARSANQVVVEEVLAEDWLLENDQS